MKTTVCFGRTCVTSEFFHACDRETRHYENEKTRSTYVRIHKKRCAKCRAEATEDFGSAKKWFLFHHAELKDNLSERTGGFKQKHFGAKTVLVPTGHCVSPIDLLTSCPVDITKE